MHIDDITLENFGPYYGEQALEFGFERPITIIHADNMRGKTSFLNAIRWCFYGSAYDRSGKPIPFNNLLNWKAASEGHYSMSVKMRFHVDDSYYELTRSLQAKTQNIVPSKNSDYETLIFLRKDGNHLKPDVAKGEINRIFPEQISRFFLFDGEQLNQYEALLSQAESQSRLIRDSIEQILGVPALTNTKADLEANLKDAAKRQRLLASKSTNARQYSEQAEELENEITVLEEDVIHLNSELEKHNQEKEVLNIELQRTAGIEADAKRLNDFIAQKEKLKNQRDSLEIDKKEKLKQVWIDILYPKISRRLKELRNERDRLLEVLNEKATLVQEENYYRSLKTSELCPICGQSTTNIATEEVETQLHKIETALQDLDFDEQRWRHLGNSVGMLETVSTTGSIEIVARIERDLSRLNVEIIGLDTNIENLQSYLRDYHQVEVVRNRHNYDAAVKIIGDLETKIRDQESKIQSKKEEASKLRSKIGQVSGPELERLNYEVKLYDDLIQVFHEAIYELKGELLAAVEEDATEIFKSLISDKTYRGLRINAAYGLAILDSSGGEVPVRSAGAEQVVALSLIGALNRNAIRSGPIIMDTPFGRLDPNHRENILRFIPKMSSQVTLLVHGGEVNRESDLAAISSKIGQEYELEYVSSKETRILKVKE